MAKSVLDWKVRRNVSENPKTTKEAMAKAGSRLLEADFLAEALDLLQKAGDKELIGRIRLKAVEEGNFFLYKRACQAAGDPLLESELRALAKKASSLGLANYESKALELLGEAAKTS
jgi:hypothetical protein